MEKVGKNVGIRKYLVLVEFNDISCYLVHDLAYSPK